MSELGENPTLDVLESIDEEVINKWSDQMTEGDVDKEVSVNFDTNEARLWTMLRAVGVAMDEMLDDGMVYEAAVCHRLIVHLVTSDEEVKENYTEGVEEMLQAGNDLPMGGGGFQ